MIDWLNTRVGGQAPMRRWQAALVWALVLGGWIPVAALVMRLIDAIRWT